MQLLKPENKKTSILPLFAVGTFGLNLFTLLLLMFHGSMLQQLNRQFTPRSLVQLIDGRAITVDPKPSFERHPEAIRRFVGETMTLMLTWSPKQPSTAIWEASSQLLGNNLQAKFLSEINELSSSTKISNTTRSDNYVLVIQKISQPTPVGEGRWKVEMFANQLIFNGSDNLGKTIPFNKQIVVRAIDEPVISLPSAPQPWHLAAFRLGEARLEIYNICDMNDTNCAGASNK
ncbi:hypothetical protein NOS3756_26790 [Nostoc sp. NIES-3756]|jgi:hypothetical protein|uniref:hypothetical protein n=1 Tax=Nostoc sp. NIES-3756 TaxID=1751286 RepID=UPI00071EC5C3|nr:hypothetical protein [Nostoc sp. NIES-3756]BAT53717.1 hypothetical protein NOS3756_26790 [Nostoc sp. NIES-3756]BAY38528.1 hypothetical protein NIES2111_28760 [Nostoc sp. NIES-2111]